ncbi:MAG: SH3 domain-containing protein [Chloroflexi bacterium]|nr:SH3 domain-containing protein [Chloroflexota bacterium]
MKKSVTVLVSIGAAFALVAGARADEVRQVPVSPTPVSISIPSPIPFAEVTQAGPATAPTATRTPTPVGPAMLQAITEANVRAQPDPESERLGTIRAGVLYPVIGRYFRWLQFQYDQSPSGTGWVFDELVEIVGDASVIRDLSAEAVPTTDPALLEQTVTAEAITLVPGGAQTATANARVISIPAPPLPGLAESSNPAVVGPEGTAEAFPLPVGPTLLPTFTFPPNFVPATPTEALAVAAVVTPTEAVDLTPLPSPANIPPIVPILLLGAMGVLGLAVSSFRR